jgi:hypothetical protein
MEYTNHLITTMGAAQMDGSGNSTYHLLSGHANGVYMCGESSQYGFWYTFSATASSGATTACVYVPPWTPVIVPTNHPTYVTLIDTAGAAFDVSIVEFF